MEKLTETFGKHLENLGALYESLMPVVQNPAFSRMIHERDAQRLMIADKFGEFLVSTPAQIPNCYDEHACIIDESGERQSHFLADGQPILIVRSDAIIFSEKTVAFEEYFKMLQFKVDKSGYLHVREMEILHDDLSIENTIYDRHGVELQRDTLSDKIPKMVKGTFNLLKKNPIAYQSFAFHFFMQYCFRCGLGRIPYYARLSTTRYLGYHRNMENFGYCRIFNDEGNSFQKRLDVSCSPATMKISDSETYPPTKEDLAKGIAEEENEETRNALIEYCKCQGVSKKMVAGILLNKN